MPGWFKAAGNHFNGMSRQLVRSLPPAAQNKLREVRVALVDTQKAMADVGRAANTEKGRQAMQSAAAAGLSAAQTVRKSTELAATVSATAAAAPTGFGAVIGGAKIIGQGVDLGYSVADTYQKGRQAYGDFQAVAQTAEGQQAGKSSKQAVSSWGKVFSG